jgi:hypothetical protein
MVGSKTLIVRSIFLVVPASRYMYGVSLCSGALHARKIAPVVRAPAPSPCLSASSTRLACLPENGLEQNHEMTPLAANSSYRSISVLPCCILAVRLR